MQMSPEMRTLQRVLPILAVLAFLFLVVVSRHAAPRTIRMHWDYDYKHDPPCASRWEENCTRGFYVFIGQTAGRSEQSFVDNRFDNNHRVMSEGLETAFQVRKFGYLQFCVVAVKQGAMSTTVESVPLCKRQLVLPLRVTRKRWR